MYTVRATKDLHWSCSHGCDYVIQFEGLFGVDMLILCPVETEILAAVMMQAIEEGAKRI